MSGYDTTDLVDKTLCKQDLKIHILTVNVQASIDFGETKAISGLMRL